MDHLWMWGGRNPQVKPLIFGREDERGAAKLRVLPGKDWEDNLIYIERGYSRSLH